MILDDKDIIRLTGYKQHCRQRVWLNENGIQFRVGHDGKPKVMVSHLESVMGGNKSEPIKKRVEPNVAGFRKHLGLSQ
jgi:hypothetical protein